MKLESSENDGRHTVQTTREGTTLVTATLQAMTVRFDVLPQAARLRLVHARAPRAAAFNCLLNPFA